ncbi:MAG: MotA/TolQ/ExbB proton channel family protein [Rhodopirellula sp. JB044]|uniref:MotA/TolQ/ExbB proton channel family protein n=1 Tax=Rhodopirellula sp. JB044 TaxID=3342844 RepID=UPI00370C2055
MTQTPEDVSQDPSTHESPGPTRPPQSATMLGKLTPLVIGLAGGCAFYAVVMTVNWAPLNRYFMGHPVAIAATMLFTVAVSILAFMTLDTASQQRSLRLLRDADLMPPPHSDNENTSPAERWQIDNDAGYVARSWRAALAGLPGSTRQSSLVRRLDEVLTRQSHRSTTTELPEDLRELSVRDADAAHDSLGLIRIIVWAIPMLGFLGTVIGITQTLGGLDFTDGTAAVDRLKSGLYVAFDTTALGLVLSVVAIFLQFPVERGMQSLLVDIDERVRNLVSLGLPADNPADSQTAMITHLCSGIETAVAESLATQAKLWRETIEEAQEAWRSQHTEGAEQFRHLLQSAMKPALTHHADRIDASIGRLDGAAGTVENALREQTALWRGAMEETATEVQTHRRTLLTHTEAMTTLASRQSDQDASLKNTLLQAIETQNRTETNGPALDPAVTQAMTTLARAVEMLSTRLPQAAERPTRANASPGRPGRSNEPAATANGSANRGSLGRAA